MKKLIITLTIFLLILIAVLIAIRVVDWGRLTVNILKRSTGYEIVYGKIKGNILTGYELNDYVIRISPTDSIFGRHGQVSYRLSPLSFRLPTIFQINLLEPTLSITRTAKAEKESKFSVPAINISLRINIKNGRIIYRDRNDYEIEHISGLIFVDFFGKGIYLTTMNLSMSSSNYPVEIYSANLLCHISSDKFEFKSFQIKGKGFQAQGTGSYLVDEKEIVLDIKKGIFDFDKIGIFTGKWDIQGKLLLKDGKPMPIMRGSASQVYFIDGFNFESNVIADTAIVNLFEGQALNGNFSAQIRFSNLKDFIIETNFRNLNIGKFINQEKPVLVTGTIGFKNKRFQGSISSPAENGLAIESLNITGVFDGNKVYIDNFDIDEEDLKISARGMLYPEFDMNLELNHINLKKLQQLIPVQGSATGNCNVKGDFDTLQNTIINGSITFNDCRWEDFYAKYGILTFKNFVWKKSSEKINIAIDSFCYKNACLDSIMLSIGNDKYFLIAVRNQNRLTSTGTILNNGRGQIDSLTLIYNNIPVFNLMPVSFDIFNRKLGTFHLQFAGGNLYGSLTENKLYLTDLHLDEIFKFFGIKEKIKGKANLQLENNMIAIKADSIYYRGMTNGTIIITGKYLKDKIQIEKILISDDRNQSLNGYGVLSMERSNIHLKFSDVRPWVFPFLNTFMENPDGLMNGEIDFAGNFNDFGITGQGEIENASLTINVISTKFDSASARVRFNAKQIIFENIIARASSVSLSRSTTKSLVSGGGIVKLEPKFRVENLSFDFSFQDAPLQYQNYAYGVGSGNISISMKNRVMFYNGNINIKEGISPLEFGTYIESGASEEKQEWRMNLRLSGDRNIWLRNRDTDIEFGGEVYIIKEQTPLYVSGVLETKRGNYYWLNHILKITTGKVTFIPGEIIDPELDIWAEMNTRERDAQTNQEIKIVLHCTGPISEPVFEFFSDPPLYSEQDILTYLNLNITWREIESMKQGEYVGRILPQSILAWLESDVSRRLRAYTGLDYFRIEAPLFEPGEKTKVTVGKYVSRNLFVTYTYDITSYSNEFNVEYFIDDRNQILIRRDETGEYSLQYQYRIRF